MTDQHAPSTGQPGVVVTEIASGHGNLTAWANELVTAAVELARKHRLALVGGETRIITAQPESDFDHYFNATRRLNSEVDSLRQQLAEAERDVEIDPLMVVTLADGTGFEGYGVCATCSEPIDLSKPESFYGKGDALFHKRACHLTAGAFRLHLQAEHLRAERDEWEQRAKNAEIAHRLHAQDNAHLRAQVEELRQRASDYEIAEGTAVAQRNKALNEALGYKRQAEAMRGVVEAARESWVVLQSLSISTVWELAPVVKAEVDHWAKALGDALAALDAASAGQSER